MGTRPRVWVDAEDTGGSGVKAGGVEPRVGAGGTKGACQDDRRKGVTVVSTEEVLYGA